MFRKMTERLNLRKMPTTHRIKIANCSSKLCVGSLENLPYFLILDESPGDAIVWLPKIVQLRAQPDYYGMSIKINFNGDSEILNYEYEHENGHTSEDKITSVVSEDTIDEDTEEELVLMLRHEDPKGDATDEE